MSEKIVQLNDEVIKGQSKELVCGSVEETLNELLEKEAESLTQAARYERSEARQGYRSGHDGRNLTTTSGDVTLHVPRFKGVPFETAIIERYRRRESNVSSKPRINIELRRATMCGNTPKSFSCRSCL
jgi:putative transposase